MNDNTTPKAHLGECETCGRTAWLNTKPYPSALWECRQCWEA